MIIKYNGSGELCAVPTSIPQGSALKSVNVIVPSRESSVALRLLPPCMEHVPDVICTPSLELSEYAVIWTAELPREVARHAGRMRYQIVLTDSLGEVHLSPIGSIQITPGVPTDMPESASELSQYSLEQIYTLLSQTSTLYGSIASLTERADMLEGLENDLDDLWLRFNSVASEAQSSANAAAESALEAQGYANNTLRDVKRAETEISENRKRIINLEERIEPEPFITDDRVAMTRIVPQKALPYAYIPRICGACGEQVYNVITFDDNEGKGTNIDAQWHKAIIKYSSNTSGRISGKWTLFTDEEFRHYLVDFTSLGLYMLEVNFESNGSSYSYMVLNTGDDIYYSKDCEMADSVLVFTNQDGWVDDAYATVDFGTEMQNMDYWFMNSFCKCAESVPDVISGTWTLSTENSEISEWFDYMEGQLSIPFTSCGEHFDGMLISNKEIRYLNSESKLVYERIGGWQNQRASVERIELVGNLMSLYDVYAGAYGSAETVIDGIRALRMTTAQTVQNSSDVFRENTVYTVSLRAKSVPNASGTVAPIIFTFFYSDGTMDSVSATTREHDWTEFTFFSAEGKTVSAVGAYCSTNTVYTYIDEESFRLYEGDGESTVYEIHESIRAIPTYGLGDPENALRCNYIDLESKSFVEVGDRMFGKWREHAEPKVTDISEYLTDMPPDAFFRVEAGGRVIFSNSCGLDVPGEITYQLKA